MLFTLMNVQGYMVLMFLLARFENQRMNPFVFSCAMYRNETHEVVKYLEYCVHRLQNEDPGVHNLLLSLYAKQVENYCSFMNCTGLIIFVIT